jgi:iron uptake system component EfeO
MGCSNQGWRSAAPRQVNVACAVPVLVCTAVLITGCGQTGGSAPVIPSPTEVKIALSDAGCEPQPASAPAGPVKFAITNSGSPRVTEAELLRDGRILGEKKNIKPAYPATLYCA